MTSLAEQAAMGANRLIDRFSSWRFGAATLQIAPNVIYPKFARLYENAKRDQWNAATEFARDDGSVARQMSFEARQAGARIWSQFYYGERGAQVVSAELVGLVKNNEAAKFLSTQAFDEARHVEVFEHLLPILDRVHPMNPFLNALLTDLRRVEDVAEKLIGMNLLVEGLAITSFRYTVEVFDARRDIDAAARDAVTRPLKLIIKDESRHVGFGTMFVPLLLRETPRARRYELALRQLTWMGLLFGSVKYHARDAELFGVDYLAVAKRILADHQERLDEMGCDSLIDTAPVRKMLPVVDRTVDEISRATQGASHVVNRTRGFLGALPGSAGALWMIRDAAERALRG